MYGHIAEEAHVGDNFIFGYNVFIMEDVKIGDNVIFGNNIVVYPGTQVGNDVIIGDFTVLGKKPQLSATSTAKSDKQLEPLILQDGSKVGTSSIVSAGVIVGEGAVIGDRVGIRENVNIGKNVVIGMGVTVENGTTIGDFTKIQTGAYVTAYVTIEERVFIAPMVTMTNDNFMGRTQKRLKLMKGAHIRKGARVGGNAILLPAIEIGEEAFIAAGSIVTKNVPPKKVVMGVPARVIRDVPEEELLDYKEIK